MIKPLLISLLFSILTINAQAAERVSLQVDTSRLVTILSGITGRTVANDYKEIQELAEKSNKPIYIELDSPGGTVRGFYIVRLIKKYQARGIKFHCYVKNMAASMAFIILNACDNRYAFDDSLLLWHSASTYVQGKAEDILRTLAQLLIYDSYIKSEILGGTGMTVETYIKGDQADAFWPAKFIIDAGLVKPGYLKLLDDIQYTGPTQHKTVPGSPSNAKDKIQIAPDHRLDNIHLRGY